MEAWLAVQVDTLGMSSAMVRLAMAEVAAVVAAPQVDWVQSVAVGAAGEHTVVGVAD